MSLSWATAMPLMESPKLSAIKPEVNFLFIINSLIYRCECMRGTA